MKENKNSRRKLKYVPKKEFVERIEKLMGKTESEKFFKIISEKSPNSIRCNTLKISPAELKEKLEKKGWQIEQPFPEYKEIMIIRGGTGPGEIGNSKEHLLGYFYVQDISSMMPILALKPSKQDTLLDLAASPGSKTTQAAAKMENKGTIIANDVSISRIKILGANLQRCGVANCIVTRKEGSALAKNILEKSKLRFDKILLDAPCTGEGTIRKSPRTLLMWNKKMIKKLSRIQKRLIESAFKILKPGGEMIYSTCTFGPEENEEVVDFLLKNYPAKIEEVKLPLKTRPGISSWEGKYFSDDIKKAVRIYPQDNDTDGFFLAKIKKIKD